MKTLQIGMTASPTRGGGLDRYFFSLLRALPNAGVDSIGLVVGDPQSLPGHVGAVESFAPLGASMLSRWSGLRKQVAPRINSCDIVVSHFAPYALPVLDLLKDRPLVVQFHGPWKLESMVEGDSAVKGAVKGMIEKIVYGRAKRFIVLSRAFAQILANEYGVPERLIRVVPGGVDLSRFDSTVSVADVRARIGWPTDRPIVFSVRRLVRAKGLENLIEAAEIVRKFVPNVLFIIAGSGPLEPELRGAIAQRGLDEHVRLFGYIAEEELPMAYAAADLFVVPTIALEGFGLVVVESLACGTPALVTPVGGLPEVVADLDGRLILPGFSAADVAEGIRRALVPSPSSVLPTREECKSYARRFDWQVIAARVADVYREVI